MVAPLSSATAIPCRLQDRAMEQAKTADCSALGPQSPTLPLPCSMGYWAVEGRTAGLCPQLLSEAEPAVSPGFWVDPDHTVGIVSGPGMAL